MIDSGNTVGDLVSEEFADRLGLEGAIVEGEVKELTTAADRTLQIMRRGLAAKQEVERGREPLEPQEGRSGAEWGLSELLGWDRDGVGHCGLSACRSCCGWERGWC